MTLFTATSIAFCSFRPARKREQYNSRPLLGALLGVTLSLIPLTVVLNLSEGMIEGIVNRFLETESYHLRLFSYADKSEEDFLAEKEAVAALEEVTRVWGERLGAGLAYSEQAKTGIAIRAVEPNLHTDDEGFRRYIEVLEGRFDLTGERSCVLGESVAAKLGVGPGDRIKLLTGKAFPNGTYLPKVTPVTVTGVITSGYQELDRLWVFIPYELGGRILSSESSEHFLGVKVVDPYADLDGVLQRIGAVSVGSNWRAYTWDVLNRGQMNSYRTTRSMLVIIMAMLVAVAALNVSSSLVMLVIENRQSIGIMKCMGASPGGIRLIYLLTGLFVGIGGAIFGCGLGVLISLYVNELLAGVDWLIGLIKGESYSLLNSSYYLQTIPVSLRWDWTLLVGLGAALLSWASSAIPAAQAAKIRPLEVIRKY